VVGVSEDGRVRPLLCQQVANPPAFQRGFMDRKKKSGGAGRYGKKKKK
jgi:hypothetical protein